MADSLKRILTQPREAAMVKLADRIVNLGPPPPDWSEEKIASYRQEARLILDALGLCSPTLSRHLGKRIALYPNNPA